MTFVKRSSAFVAIFGAFLCSTLGCSPGLLGLLLMDDKAPPEYKLASKDKEITVAVACQFATPAITRTELMPSDTELSERLIAALRKRFAENKEKVKLVASSKVRALQQRQGTIDSPIEIGKQLKADYVINLDINHLELYEPASSQMLFRGNTDITVTVYNLMAQNDGEPITWDKSYRREFPNGYPTPASDTSVIQFRTQFLNRVAEDLSNLFASHPAEVGRKMD